MASRSSALSLDLSNPWSLALAHPRIVLSILCLLLYLPGLGTLPPLDRDESRFTQSTKQMIETGDFVQPRLQEVATPFGLIAFLRCSARSSPSFSSLA